MKNTIKKFLLFLLVLIFSINVFAADTGAEAEPKYDSGLKFKVADDVSEGGTRLRIEVSGTPNADAVRVGSLSLTIPSDKVTTNISTTIPVEMENSTYDIQEPRAILQEPLEIYGVKDASVDTSSVITASNFTFKEIAPETDISSWIKFSVTDQNGTKYIYANQLDTDANKNEFGSYIIPRGLKYEVDEVGVEDGENSIGIRVHGTPDAEITNGKMVIEMPASVITRARANTTRTFDVSGSNMEQSLIAVSNVRPVLKNPQTIVGTANFPLAKSYSLTIALEFRDDQNKFPTFVDLNVGDDVSSWFSDVLTGVNKESIDYKVKSIDNTTTGFTQSSIVIEISGTPTEFNDLKPTIMIPRDVISSIKDNTSLPESFFVIKNYAVDNELTYDIAEYPGTTRFSQKSVLPGTVGVPYQMDTTVVFNSVDAEVPLKYDDRPLRSIGLEGGLEFNKAFKAGDDITSWFTNAPAGLVFSVYKDTAQYDKSLMVLVSGTAEAVSNEEIDYTIPADVLAFTGVVNAGASEERSYSHRPYVPEKGVTVSSENRSNYAIRGISVKDPETLFVSGPASDEINAVTAQVVFADDNLRFKESRNAGFDISSWFKNVWANNQKGRSDQFKYTLETPIVNGSNGFTFKVSGFQGDAGMQGAGLIFLEVPSNLLQDISGAELPASYNFKVAVSTSYGDVAEEYARLFLANPTLKIISEDTDFWVTESQLGTFDVVYRLQNAKFDTTKIDTEQIYYAWANDSLKENAAEGETYDNLWTYYGPDSTNSVQNAPPYIYKDSDGAWLTQASKTYLLGVETIGVDVSRGLAVKVESVTDNTIAIKYYGVVREDFLNRGSEQLYLTIPKEYFLQGPTNGVRSENAITLHYVRPVIAFAPYGFYANDTSRETEIRSFATQMRNRMGEDFDLRLTYDLVGVSGQDLATYSYDIKNAYEKSFYLDYSTQEDVVSSRNEEYHYYAFAPLGFDLEYDVGDDVTSLFFSEPDQIGITWKVIAKEKNRYKNLTIEQMSSWTNSDGESVYLLGRPVTEGYIYIVKAEGIPNFYSETNDEIQLSYEIPLRKITYGGGRTDLNYDDGKIYYGLRWTPRDSMTIKYSLAPSYNLEAAGASALLKNQLSKMGISSTSEYVDRVYLNPPSYRIFGLYVPLKNWTYSLVDMPKSSAESAPYVSVSGSASIMRDGWPSTVDDLSDWYNPKGSFQVGLDSRLNLKNMLTDFIPVFIDGDYNITAAHQEFIWKNQSPYYLTHSSDEYSYRIWQTAGPGRTYKNLTMPFGDPRVNTDSDAESWPMQLVYIDKEHDYRANYYSGASVKSGLPAGGIQFVDTGVPLWGKTSGKYWLPNPAYLYKDSTRYDGSTGNNIFYIAFRPTSKVLSDGNGDLSWDNLTIPQFVTTFDMWLDTALLEPNPDSAYSLDNPYRRQTKVKSYTWYRINTSNWGAKEYSSLGGDATLSPECDYSLPRYLKITPANPYLAYYNEHRKIVPSDVLPGIITSGSSQYRALFDKTVNIDLYLWQALDPIEVKLSLINTTYAGSFSGRDITSWFNFPEGITAIAGSVDSTGTELTVRIIANGDVETQLTDLTATVPAEYNAAGEDLLVFTKGSTFTVKSFEASFTGSVEGYTQKTLKRSTITLSFSNGMTFADSLLNKDVSAWFSPIGGVKFVVTKVSGSTITVEPQGAPLTETFTDVATISIPSSALSKTSLQTDDVTIFTLENLKYRIYEYTVVTASIPSQVVVYNVADYETGMQNAYIFDVGLYNTTFNALQVGSDVSSWFGSSKKDGYNYVLKDAVKEGANRATIAVYGTPTASYNGNISITIPSDALYNYPEAITVNTRGSIYKEMNQKASIVGSGITIDKFRNNNFYQDFTIELTESQGFIAISRNYNVSSWFNTILLGDVTFRVLNAVRSGDTQITIRMSTTSATASTYDTAVAYTITIPKTALVFSKDPLSVDVKGGTMRFKNYSAPSLKTPVPIVIKQKDYKVAAVRDPRDKKDALFLRYNYFTKDHNSAFISNISGRFAKDNGDMKSYHYFLFTFNNIQQIGHTTGQHFSQIAKYTSYSYLVKDSNGIKGAYRWARPYTMTTVSHGQDGDGNWAATVIDYGKEDYSLYNDLPEVFIAPRSGMYSEPLMNTTYGQHIPNMMELWIHTYGGSVDYLKTNSKVDFSYGSSTSSDWDIAKKSFQVLLYKEHKCTYGNGTCNLFKQGFGNVKEGYIDIDFRVPVIDLGGNKVWVWARMKNFMREESAPIRVGHYMY